MKFERALVAAVMAVVTQAYHEEHEEIVKNAYTYFLDKERAVQVSTEIGVPAMHEKPLDECHGAGHLCSQHGTPVILQAGHHVRAKNNSPIFGVLTQPVPSDWKDQSAETFVESSHIEFLQAAGARVVHLDYRMSQRDMKKELEQLNGVYIPGDTKAAFMDPEYIYQVSDILAWAETHNSDESNHFPIVGVSWGMMSMIKSQMKDTSKLVDLPEWMAGEAIQQNLNLTPFETFTYDEWTPSGLEDLLDKVDFYNELDMGIALKDFNQNKGMRAFVPVATWDSDTISTTRFDEYVSMIEGHFHPFFGFGYRLDKVQFGFHETGTDGHSKVDHHKKSIQHAQRIANLIVDEARLSGNRYKWTNTENDRLITNQDVSFVEVPSPHTFNKSYDDTYRTEMYFFQ